MKIDGETGERVDRAERVAAGVTAHEIQRALAVWINYRRHRVLN